jgi:hypothetical protein
MVHWYHREQWGPPEGERPAHGNYAAGRPNRSIKVPTLVVFGDADEYLLPSNFFGLEAFIRDLSVCRVAGGSDWILDEFLSWSQAESWRSCTKDGRSLARAEHDAGVAGGWACACRPRRAPVPGRPLLRHEPPSRTRAAPS